MERIIAGSQLIEFTRLCYHANRPLLLIGSHGVGKSELLEQAARALGIEYIARDLSLMEAVDLSGLPKASDGRTVYLPPKWLPRGGRGLLVFEELNRCEPQVRVPTLQLLTARCLNDYRLPPQWLPVAAVNPSDAAEGYEVDELDPALLDRFTKVRLVPDPKEWLQWAAIAGIHPAVIRYVEDDSTVFDKPESTPRGWKYVSDLLKAYEKLDLSVTMLRAGVIGQVGDHRGASFMGTLKNMNRPVPATDILDRYSGNRATVQGWIRDGRLDAVRGTLLNVLTHLQAPENFKKARDGNRSWKNLGSFLNDLPGDMQEQAREHFEGRGYDFPLNHSPRKRGRK